MPERRSARLNYDEMMKLAPIAILALLLAVPVDARQPPAAPPQKPPANATPQKPPASKPRPPAQSSSATTVATVTVTDEAGAPIPDVRVMLTGLLDRSGSTQTNGVVKFDGLRAWRLSHQADQGRFHHARARVRVAGRSASACAVGNLDGSATTTSSSTAATCAEDKHSAARQAGQPLAARLHREELHLEQPAAEGFTRGLQRVGAERALADS